MKISILCHKCQNDKADHTTEYCPTHNNCKNCGGSGHVSKVCPKKETAKETNSPYTSPSPIKKSKVCPKKETTKKPNSPYTSPSPIRKSKVCPKKETTKRPNSPYTSPSPNKKSMNSLTLSQFKELLVITKKYNKRTKLSLPSDENLEINVSPSTSDCSDDVFEVLNLKKFLILAQISPKGCQITILSIFSSGS